MSRYWKLLIGLIGLLCFSQCQAANSPTDLLKTVSEQMISALKKDKPRLAQPGVVEGIVQQVLIPHVDMNALSAQAVGPVWRQATVQQKKHFIFLFQKRVVGTYAGALAMYNDDKVVFFPIRGGYNGLSTVKVNSEIRRPSGQVIAMSYRLTKSGSTWKVIDFSVEGVSITSSYRSQFQPVIRQNGLAAVIARLQQGT